MEYKRNCVYRDVSYNFMRKFIDPDGNFLISVPIDWVYKNKLYEAEDFTPHSFEFYENPIGCFQVSCNQTSKGAIPDLIKNNSLVSQDPGTKNLNFNEKFISTDKFDMYLWMAVVRDKFILCKYIYDHSKRKSSSIEAEVAKAKDSIKTLLVIEDKYREVALASERFDKFMTSLAASIDLTNRAYENGSAIELTVLLANQIDALLRLTLILKKQLNDNTNEIDTTLIHQKSTDKPIMEKKVYDLALNEGIISQDLHDKLFDLYNQRNKVVHRYIITDLLTRDVFNISYEYSKLEEEVGNIVKQYEQKQFQSKIGIYGTDTPPDEPVDEASKVKLINALREKHAHRVVNKEITFEDKKL